VRDTQGIASAPAGKARQRNAKQVSTAAVADWIRERIRRGRFVPGQRLIEADIIEQAGASRSKVREALQRLEAEGLVSIEEYRGASVKQIGPDEIRQIYRARMALEGIAAADFAAAQAPKLKQRLAALQESMNRWREAGGHERFAELNSEWHRLIIEGSGNAYVAQFVERLSVPTYRLLFSSFYTDRGVDDANADHQAITAAIVDGRAADAEAAMRQHISDGLAAVSDIAAQLID
jgi:DNA-binding GntR family transcriptional regulator